MAGNRSRLKSSARLPIWSRPCSFVVSLSDSTTGLKRGRIPDMSIFSRLPWWSGFPMSLGMGVMGVFAPAVMPAWWQKLFFFAGTTFFALGAMSAFWHFGLGRWFSRHVWWRFRPHAPGSSPIVVSVGPSVPRNPKKRCVTAADRDRISELIRDVADFVGGDLYEFQSSLVHAIGGTIPPDFAKTQSLLEVQMDLSRRAVAMHQRHAHYLTMIDLEILPVYRDLSDIREPMTAAIEAKDWPAAAQAERCTKLNYAYSHLGNTMRAIEAALSAKRLEFIDNSEIVSGESQPKPMRFTSAERERLTDRLIKLDDYLTAELPKIIDPIRELLEWQERLRHSSGAGQIHDEVEAMRQPFAAQTRNVGLALRPYEVDTEMLPGFAPMAIKTKMLPISEGLREFTDVTQALPKDYMHYAPLALPGGRLNTAIVNLSDEIERVRREGSNWRKRISQGEFD